MHYLIASFCPFDKITVFQLAEVLTQNLYCYIKENVLVVLQSCLKISTLAVDLGYQNKQNCIH